MQNELEATGSAIELNSAVNERGRFSDKTRLMAGAYIGLCLGNYTAFSAPFFIGTLIDDLGITEGSAGLITTLEISAVAATCLLLSGFLSRLSLRSLVMAALFLLVTANVASLMVDGYTAIMMCRIIAGVSAGACLAASGAIISRTFDPDKTVGTLLVINTVVMMVALYFMGVASQAWSYEGVVAVHTLIGLLVFPLVYCLPTTRFDQTSKQNKQSNINHHLMLGIIGVSLLFIVCIVEGSVYSFSERIAKQIGFDGEATGAVLAGTQFFGLLGGLLAALLGARIPRILPIGIGVMLMGYAGFIIYQTDIQWVFISHLCLYSFGFFLGFPYLLGSCARLDSDGRWAARANSINLLGVAVAPVIAGGIISHWNYQTLGEFCLGLAGVCLIINCYFAYQFKQAKLD